MIVFQSGRTTGLIKKFPENFLKRKEIVTELIMETILWNTDQEKLRILPMMRDFLISYSAYLLSILFKLLITNFTINRHNG